MNALNLIRWFVCASLRALCYNRSGSTFIQLFPSNCSAKMCKSCISFRLGWICADFRGNCESPESTLRHYRLFFSFHYVDFGAILMKIWLDCLTRKWETIKRICAYIMRKHCTLSSSLAPRSRFFLFNIFVLMFADSVRIPFSFLLLAQHNREHLDTWKRGAFALPCVCVSASNGL